MNPAQISKVINLRSDTQSLPTEEMLEAMQHAALGDDTYDEDPTVQKFEGMAAKTLGKEAALLVISGQMGNLVALMAHASPGDEVVLDQDSHIFYYEVGSMANVAGLMPMLVQSHNGMLDSGEVKTAIRKKNLHYPIPRLLCLENTHNRSGGRVMPLSLHQELCRIAHEHGMAVHLDGARIFNAAIKAGLPASRYAEEADSVMFCLSKGLSCPLGSVVVGTRDFIAKADRCRKRLGGGMRQAGVIAACGIVALDKMIDRLAEDHRTAQVLAKGLSEIPGLHVDMETVETNMVYVDHSASGLGTDEVLAKFKRVGVLASGRPPKHVRLVTYRQYDKTMIEEAVTRIRAAMEK
jgi:threonine aldolase